MTCCIEAWPGRRNAADLGELTAGGRPDLCRRSDLPEGASQLPGEREMAALRQVHVYDAPDTPGLDIGQVAGYLAEMMPPVAVDARGDFFTHHLARFTPDQIEVITEELGARLAEREVHDLPEDRELGAVYDGSALQDVMVPLIPEQERGEDHLHIVFLTHCIGRREPSGEFSLHIIQPGRPALVSTTCFVEAPELPREYLFRRAQLEGFGMAAEVEALEDEFAARTLTHADPRVTEVAKGYALQAAFRHLLGTAACEQVTCRLHEARTHDELTSAQISAESRLCERHAEMLRQALE